MTITRTFCSASLLALAAIRGPVAPGYAGVYGKYINLKTGKEVKPPKGAVAPGSVGSAASAAKQVLCETRRSNCTTRVLIFEHERLSREPKGKGWDCYKF
jgi:hypothetical protein